MRYLLLFGVLALASCTFFDKMKRSDFTYTEGGEPRQLRLLVPSGYSKIRRATDDSTGNQEQVYVYRDGSLLYVAYAQDTTKRYSVIDTAEHTPKLLTNGARYFKGIDPDWTYWKEIRNGRFRLGYHQVSVENEGRFDSSINYSNSLLGAPPRQRP